MKKLLLGLTLSVSLLSSVQTAQASYFTDTQGHWAYSFIEDARSRGFVSGKTDTTYDPDGLVTGNELATMISNAVLLDDMASQTGGWPTKQVNTIKSVVNSESLDNISFENSLTRIKAASMIGGVLNAKGYYLSTYDSHVNVTNFSDMSSNVSGTYFAGVTLDSGIMSGQSATTFNPYGTLTRGEAAVIVMNLINQRLFVDQYGNSGFTPPDYSIGGSTPSTGTSSSKPSTSSNYPAVSAVGSYNIPADLNKDGWVTEEEVMTMLKTIQNTSGYKQGDSWDDSKYYRLVNSGALGGSATGCAAFAFEVSDLLFGNTPFIKYTASSFDAARDLKAGDVIHSKTLGHWWIVIDSYQNSSFSSDKAGTVASFASGNTSGGIVSWKGQGSFYSEFEYSLPRGNVDVYSRYPS